MFSVRLCSVISLDYFSDYCNSIQQSESKDHVQATVLQLRSDVDSLVLAD